MNRRPALAVGPLALVVAVTLGTVPRVLEAQRGVADTAAEPVIVELQIGRIARATVQGYRVRTEVLLPLSPFFQLVEVRHRVSPEGRVEATMDPGNRRIVIDVARDTMQFGERLVRIEREFRRFEGGEVYVGAERLGDLFGLRFAVDWAELTVTVVDPGALPLARRLRREVAREAYLRRGESARADVTFALERPRGDGVVLDYSLLAPSADPVSGSGYSLGLGADLRATDAARILRLLSVPRGVSARFCAARSFVDASASGACTRRRATPVCT